MSWLVLASGIATNAAASLIMKRAMADGPAAALQHGALWLGVLCYGLSFVCYATSLTLLPLNVAHPVLTCGAVAAVAVGSVTFYSETLSATTLAGIVLVLAGVVLITREAA